jgi:multiple sugar transport system substrate-binding protein
MKKNYSIRLLSAAAIMAIGGGMLTSCGGETAKAIDMTADTRGATITFWTGFGSAVTTHLETVLSEFTDKTGIKVTHEGKGGYDNLQTAINLSASTGTYPNVAIGYPDHFAGYVDSNIILHLDDFIANDSQIPEKQADGFEELPKLDINDFYSDYMTENQSIEYDANGKGYTLGLPFNKSTEVMVYNKTFFDNDIVKAAGIALPTTWDEVKDQTTKILTFVKDKGAYNKILGVDGNVYTTATDIKNAKVKTLLDLSKIKEGGLHPLSYDSQANFFITGVRQWGGTYTEVDKATRKGYIKFQSQETYDSLSKFNEIYQAGGLAIPATFGEANYCSAEFKLYQSLMNIGSSAGVSNAVPSAGAFETACAPIPFASADKKYVISQGTNLCMFDTGTNVEKLAAWKLIKYLSQYNNGEFAALTGYFPSCKSAYNSTVYQEFMNSTAGSDTDKLNRSAATINGTVYTAENSWHKFVDPGFNGSSTIRTSIGTVTGQVFIDKKAPADVVAAKYAELKDYLAA